MENGNNSFSFSIDSLIFFLDDGKGGSTSLRHISGVAEGVPSHGKSDRMHVNLNNFNAPDIIQNTFQASFYSRRNDTHMEDQKGIFLFSFIYFLPNNRRESHPAPLKPDGFFIFKWNNCDKSIEEILRLFPYKPLFGTNLNNHSKHTTYWIVFLKQRFEKELKIKYE